MNNTIYLEQHPFNQAYQDDGSGQTRGVNVFLPMHKTEYVWHRLQNYIDSTGLRRTEIKEAYAVKFKPGSYIRAETDAAGISFPGSAWAGGHARSRNGWRIIRNIGVTDRHMQLTVPAGTTRLYMFASPQTGAGKTDITVVSGTATLMAGKSGVIGEFDCAFGGEGAQDFVVTTPAGLYESTHPNWFSSALIARNCGGAVLDFIGKDGGAINTAGFVCINDNGDDAECNPIDGVIDPSTIVELVPIREHQGSDGPLRLSLSSNPLDKRYWWGLGHWSPTEGYLDNASQGLYYNDSTAGDWVEWFATVPTGVRFVTETESAHRRLTGDMKFYVDAETTINLGTYEGLYQFEPTGLIVSLKHTFGAGAEAANVHIHGGQSYLGQWSIADREVNRAYARPEVLAKSPIDVKEPFDDSNAFSGRSGDIWLLGNRYAFNLQAFAITDDLKNMQESFINKRPGIANHFVKIYLRHYKLGQIVPATSGLTLHGMSRRIVVPIIDAIGRAGVEMAGFIGGRGFIG